jgi:hypothetical protein
MDSIASIEVEKNPVELANTTTMSSPPLCFLISLFLLEGIKDGLGRCPIIVWKPHL